MVDIYSLSIKGTRCHWRYIASIASRESKFDDLQVSIQELGQYASSAGDSGGGPGLLSLAA